MIDPEIKNGIDDIAKVLFKLRSKSEISNFLEEMFSYSEIENIHKRWKVAQMLNDGKSYKEIERQTGVSSATVAKISESIKYGNGGLITALKRL